MGALQSQIQCEWTVVCLKSEVEPSLSSLSHPAAYSPRIVETVLPAGQHVRLLNNLTFHGALENLFASIVQRIHWWGSNTLLSLVFTSPWLRQTENAMLDTALLWRQTFSFLSEWWRKANIASIKSLSRVLSLMTSWNMTFFLWKFHQEKQIHQCNLSVHSFW